MAICQEQRNRIKQSRIGLLPDLTVCPAGELGDVAFPRNTSINSGQ